MEVRDSSVGQEVSRQRNLAVIPVSLALAVVAVLAFVWLSEEVLHNRIERFDETVRLAIHAHASPGLTAFLRVVTNLGDWGALLSGTLVLGLVFALCGMWQHLRLLLVTMSGALVLDAVLKLVVHRPRPIPYFIPKPSTYSFPSGHALVSLCFYGLLAGMLSLSLRTRWQRAAVWIAAAGLIGLIGFSRVYLGVHWPSDVLAGYAAAIVWMGAVRVMAERENRREHGPAG
jgi:undecaprenyl-diphosphatase